MKLSVAATLFTLLAACDGPYPAQMAACQEAARCPACPCRVSE